MSIINFNLVLVDAYMLSASVRHLVFKREDEQPLAFIPGQFITLLFMKEDKIIRRSYSIASIPSQTDKIEIAVSYVEGGFATNILANLNIGEQVLASGPFGRLVLKDEVVGRYLLVATGTGISPYRAMLPEIAKRIANENVKVAVLEGVQNSQQLLYGNDFVHFANQHPNFVFYACYSREVPSAAQEHERTGHVQDTLHQLQLDPAQDIIYLCGNPNMIDENFEALKGLGFTPQQIRREKYFSS